LGNQIFVVLFGFPISAWAFEMALSKLIISNFAFETISFCSIISLSKFEHGFLSGGVYAEQKAIRIIIKRFILAVENLTARSISSLGGSFMQSGGVNMSVAGKIVVSAAIGGTAEALGGGKFAHRNDSGRGFSNGVVTGTTVFTLRDSVQLCITVYHSV